MVAAVVVLGLVATLLIRGAGSTDRVGPLHRSPATAALLAEIDRWGPTRGTYAHDPAVLDRVRSEWLHPTGDYYGNPANDGGSTYIAADGARTFVAPDRSRHLVGKIRVLFAGRTPDGPAAVVAQRTSNKRDGAYIGIMLPTSANDFQLAAAYTARMYAQPEFGDAGFDASMIDFTTTTAGDHAVVLPADRHATVEVSRTHTLDGTGHVHREWTGVPTDDGVVTLSASGPIGFWDTLIRVSRNGEVLGESPVQSASWRQAGSPPAPANAVVYRSRSVDVGGIAGLPWGTGLPTDLYSSWLSRYGALDEPRGGSIWRFAGSLSTSGSGLLVQQLWLYGDPAHTVVMRVVGRTVDVLSDRITDPTARPLVAQWIAPFTGWDTAGWLVVAGPGATVDAYRDLGTRQWTKVNPLQGSTTNGHHDRSRAAVFAPSSATGIQLRLTVDGHRKVVTERHP